MSLTNSFENEVLLNWFNNSNITNIGDATGLRGSSAAGSFYIALFTADPTESGGVASECSLGGYARVAVARNSGGLTVSGNQVSNAAKISFPVVTSGTETITHWGICKESTGDNMIAYGACSFNSSETGSYTVNDRPVFNIGDLSLDID